MGLETGTTGVEKFFQSSPDPAISQFGAELETLYFAHHHDVDVLTMADGGLPKFLNIKKLVGKALDNIFKGFTGLIEPNLFRITYTALSSAIDEGWASIEYGKQNPAFAAQLKKSGAWFAARKSYRQREELAAQLMDADGKTRTWKQFQAATKQIAGDYNQNWLKVEYQTAISSARNAGRWKEFEADADLYPNLEYMPSRAATPREEHKPYYGVIRPINDDFWTLHFPPSAFNCQCGIESTDKEATDVPTDIDVPKPGLGSNPGKTGSLFNLDTHPYSKGIDKKKLKEIDHEGEQLADSIDNE
jgi:hypothetical protein